MDKEKVWKSTLEYFSGDDLATQVWIDKYALRNDEEILEESPLQMHERLAKEFYRIEKKYDNPMSYEEILKLLHGFTYFIPAGSVMFGCGNPYTYSSLANCFVIGNEFDSYGGILKNDEELVQIMKRRGGVGIDLSHLRFSRARVNNAARNSTGVVSFMERYSNTTREVAQGGRRGALMLTLDVRHPDIMDFVDIKKDLKKVTGANISVKITDEFMRAVEANEEFETSFYIHDKTEEFKSPIRKVFPARDLWNKIINNAWESAEPGILFWDKILAESPADSYTGFRTHGVNPCGEVPLCQYDSCRLGSINLYSFVKNPFSKKAWFDWDNYHKVIIDSQRLMDDLIDLEEERIDAIIKKIDSDPEPPVMKFVEKSMWQRVIHKLVEGRRTGLGVLGLGDALAALGKTYGTPEATKLAEKMVKRLAKYSYQSSIIMAEERGPFPRFHPDGDFNSQFTKRMLDVIDDDYKDLWKHHGRRNIANLAIAPTGSLAILAQTTSGVEPLFQRSYIRRRKLEEGNPNITFVDDSGDSWEEYQIFHKKWQLCMDTMIEEDPKSYFEGENSPYTGATANEIDYLEKIKMQGKLQQWIDHSISITHNVPKETTKEQISEIYLNAWKYGCKGVTIYREGSRDGVLIKSENKHKSSFPEVHAPRRDRTLPCDIYYPTIKGTQFVVLVGLYEQRPYEIFAFRQNGVKLSKSFTGGFITKVKRGYYSLLDKDKEVIVDNLIDKFELPVEEFATRMISTALRHGTPVAFVMDQLDKAPAETLQDYNKVVARVLKKYVPNGNKASGHTCSECHSNNLIYENGCIFCTQCGYSKC